MKHVLPALVAVVCTLTACQTTADHRELYSPDKAQGPYTAKLRGMTLAGRFDHKSTTYSYPVAESGPQPPGESGPIAPPPPPPPTSGMPDTNSGAPAPTPFPEAAPATTMPGSGASSSVIPGTSAPATGSEPAGAPAPAPAPDANATPAPAIPGLSQ